MGKLKANFHTHTTRCKHASGSDEEYVLAAIAAGYDTLGFSDHTPYPIPGMTKFSFRQSPEEAEDYVRSVLSLREKYKDKINILLGYETEYYPSYFSDLLDLYSHYPIDYMILGQHIVGEEMKGGVGSFGDITDVDILKKYVCQICEGMATGLYTYLAHPDCVKFVGDEDVYVREMEKVLVTAKRLNVPVELNLLGIWDHRHYPRHSLWQMVGEIGNEVIIGADAHSPSRVCDESEYDRAINNFVNPYHLNVIERPRLIKPVR